jgi:hypothetical protein
MAFDIYAEVTGKIVAMLEKGVVPWRSPILGQAKAGWPRNMESGKEYRGVNVFLLAVTAWCQGERTSGRTAMSACCWKLADSSTHAILLNTPCPTELRPVSSWCTSRRKPFGHGNPPWRSGTACGSSS